MKSSRLLVAAGLALVVIISAAIGHSLLLGSAAALAGITFLIVFRWPAIGLMASLLTLVAGQTLRIPLSAGEATVLPNDLLLPIVLLAWLARRLIDRAPILPARPLGRWLVLVSGVLGLSLMVAGQRGDVTASELLVSGLYLVRWFEYLALFFLARTVVRLGQLRNWWHLLLAITLALAFLGFLQLYFVPDFSRFVPQGWDPHVGRLLSTWYDPNFLAGFFAAIFMILLAILHEPKVGQRRWLLASGAVILAALVLTFSRSGYAGLAVGFGVLAVLRTRHFLALGLLAAFAVFLLVPRVQERVIGIRSIDETAQLRIESWRNALTVIADHPWLGVGYNTYRYVQVAYGFQEDTAEHSAGGSDSSFLTVAVTTGVIGLAVYIGFLARVFGVLWRVAKRARDVWLRSLAYGTIGAFVVLIIHGQFVNGLFYPHLLELQWVLLGLVLGGADQEGIAL